MDSIVDARLISPVRNAMGTLRRDADNPATLRIADAIGRFHQQRVARRKSLTILVFVTVRYRL